MKQTVIAWVVALACQFVIGKYGEISSIFTVAIYIVVETALRECALGQRLKWCKRPDVKALVHTEFFVTLRAFTTGCTVIGGIFLFIAAQTWVEVLLLILVVGGINTYARVLIPKILKVKENDNFRSLMDSQINGKQYDLPPWWFIKKSLRTQLAEENARKVPVMGETHLFVYRGFSRTVVRIIAPGKRAPEIEEIPETLRSELERYREKEARAIIEDPIPRIQQR